MKQLQAELHEKLSTFLYKAKSRCTIYASERRKTPTKTALSMPTSNVPFKQRKTPKTAFSTPISNVPFK